MTANDQAPLHRYLIGLGCCGLLALVFCSGDPATPVSRPRVESAAVADRGVFAMNRDVTQEASRRIGGALQTVDRSAPPPPSLPFAFLGKATEGNETIVYLYTGGRLLTVRDTGPLDDRYEVDAILDDFLVLRYLPLGIRQVLELASRQHEAIPYGSAAETPPD
jgi:hypothetical protein